MPMPMQSQAQWGYLFANKKPFADRWAKQTPGGKGARFRRLPYKKRAKDIVSATPAAAGYAHGPGGLMSAPGMGGTRKRTPLKKRKKAFTIVQLEAFVSSPHYDSATAAAIAQGIPELPRLKGEQIAPGVTRIHGNLCNVHGRYGPCDAALGAGAGAIKPRKGRAPRKPPKPKQTPAQRIAARQQQRQQNASDVAKQMAANDTGLSPSGSKALVAFASGAQPNATIGDGLVKMGLAERAIDGSYRMTATGHGVVSAMQSGDYQRAIDGISRGTDHASAQQGRAAAHTARVAASQQAHATATAARQARQQAAAAKRQARAAAKKPGKQSGSGGSKNPTHAPPAPHAAPQRPPKAPARSSIPSAPALSPNTPAKPPKAATPAKAPAKQIAPALQESVQSLSDGKQLSESDTQALIRNGLAHLIKGELVLTSAGRRATMKHYSFKVFKDAAGRFRWVAQSSTAFQDRDKEIVSTKALEDDCAFADAHQSYGPLRWWHTPGLDLGDCDFNAMHGRVLIESGTFRSPAIAQKVAAAASRLELSLGFLHLPTEPDASGVFHHIRRFERSLVPRGKASNRFTALTVKETIPMDEKKLAYLRTELKFSDAEIADIQATAAATEKAASEQGVAYKADAPELPDMIINGVTYKAFPPKAAAPDAEDMTEAPETPGEVPDAEDMAEAPEEDAGGLTLSPEDLQAVGDAVGAAIQSAVAQIMGALDLEKKVSGHVQSMMAPFQAQKDAEGAEKAAQIAALQTSLKDTQSKLDELLGLQPAITPRPSAAPASILNPFNPADNQLLAAVKNQVPADQQSYVNDFEDLKQKLFGNGQ